MAERQQFNLQDLQQSNLWAIASLVGGILGAYSLLFSIAAVIFGHIAKKEIARNPEVHGSGLATVGLVLGYIGVVYTAIVFGLFGGLILSFPH